MKIEVSTGEVIDKWTILAIKSEKIKDPAKLSNVFAEKHSLEQELGRLMVTFADDIQQLQDVNSQLWDVEDILRIKERDSQFNAEFIELARKVYILNDRRANIKKRINLASGSVFVEEKQYVNYGSTT